MKSIFTEQQQSKARFIEDNPCAKISGLISNDIRSLVTAWCYYSGKIEGNTYTLVETDALLNSGITSAKDYGDAKMLKNLYNTFVQELEYITKRGHKEDITMQTLYRVHRTITAELLDPSACGALRDVPVRVTGTSYIPPREKVDIMYELNQVLEEQHSIEDPIERSVFLHCNIARIQPFRDGNKRTSRMIESIVLMNSDIIPVYSVSKEDIKSYKDAIIHFYETMDYSAYADYSLNQQIARINEIAPAKYQYQGEGLSFGLSR